jgi:hypothetical protein
MVSPELWRVAAASVDPKKLTIRSCDPMWRRVVVNEGETFRSNLRNKISRLLRLAIHLDIQPLGAMISLWQTDAHVRAQMRSDLALPPRG